jgi:hypothetical protein
VVIRVAYALSRGLKPNIFMAGTMDRREASQVLLDGLVKSYIRK